MVLSAWCLVLGVLGGRTSALAKHQAPKHQAPDQIFSPKDPLEPLPHCPQQSLDGSLRLLFEVTWMHRA